MEHKLTKEQTNTLLTLAREQEQTRRVLMEIEASITSQLELLKAFYKLEGEAKFEQKQDGIYLVVFDTEPEKGASTPTQ